MDKRKINLAKFRFEKAEEELEISKTLFDKEYFGASLSSSYYAIFHAVRTVFAFEEIDSKRHTGIIYLFSEHFVKTGYLNNELRKILSHAFEHRLDSDYVDFYIVEKATAEKQIDNAEYFIKEISNFVKSFYKIEL